MSDIVFEKTKGRGWAERVFKQKQPSKRFFKKRVMKYLQNSQENIYAGIIKVLIQTVNYDTKPKAYVPI